ncbi:SusC/RagA family TonB-linked outer membrane protein [Marinilongibacter aquaticus]|uniref:SusC/RagA family TonB-linked outer membrane protein n=1 Tax=Marinilongibacter aquaticus TaxID=2975157 RepID=UPI0021BDDC36|nr:SusC/RagA family TonB-linked outer membrane protein [Marinilongibacter aquaticus]UBM57340.1 SusC/RagA family TonB-linked outer membrane protein [Marinilongibacter aquaticus]
MKFSKLFLGLYLISLGAMAQQIRGTVSSANDKIPLPGVSVIVKGSTVGTTTDASGKYELQATADQTLVFSFVGYTSQEIAIGSKSIVDVALVEDNQSLDEVVVTALGIKKDAKKLGYATSTVGKEALTENRQPNFMNALQGKVAGVNIQQMGTGPGGTSKIRIRGQSSISGQNSPLIVVNGVPIDNTNFGTNQNNQGSDSSVGVRGGGGVYSDGGDGLSSINPDDIESMTILKGATAAALYGSRAKDGVIMITTKTGSDSQGIGLTYNSNFTSETALDFTDYQYEYGQGENGLRPTSPNPTSGQWSFGEKFQPGMTQVLFDGVEVPYVPIRDRYKIFYRNGQNWTNTVSLSAGGVKGGLNLSFANMDSKGIVPNNSFNRKTINLGFSYNLSERLSFTGSMNYSNEYNKNPPNIANQDNSIPTSVAIMANSMPWDLLDEKKYDADGNEYVYSRFRNRTNPYFTLAEQFHNIRRDRIFGNIAVKYNLADWLFVQARVGQDYWSRDEDYNNFPTGQASRGPAPAGFVNGMYTQEARRFREINKDILISGSKSFGDFGLDFNLGGNQMYRRSDLNSTQVTDFVVRGLYTVMNGRVKNPIYNLSERGVNSVYGSAELSYKGFLFLNGTARNDWFSTLSAANRSILYPSVSGSFVFSQAMANSPAWLDFGKLRLAYAEVGSDTDVGPYSNALFYAINANLFQNQPVGSSQGTTVPNANLRPMRVAEQEVGIELKMFDRRVSLDFAMYKKITSDQIVTAQVSDASGFQSTLINSGKSRTLGFEWLLGLNPVRTGNFNWDINFNGSFNKTKLLSLLTDTPGERITTGTHVFNGELRQVVGQELAQLYGFGFKRDAQGRMVFGSNGIPLRTDEQVSFGSALPNWVGGITNSFNYKGISLSALVDFKLGGNMMSGTNFNLVRHGLHKMTLPGRDTGVIGEGVNENGEPNTVAANPQSYWEVIRGQSLIEPIIYNAGFWKLRQITLGYDFSKFLPEKSPLKSLKLSAVANNVAMLKKWVPNIDPDSFGYTSDNIVGLESTGVPTTRSIGFNLNVKF